jgi:hypothetical protein
MGAFDVLDTERRSVRPSGRKECALLAMLALTRNHRQTRTWLQEKLWSDRGPAQAAASLRQTLTTLRSLFNSDVELILADRTWVWLDPNFFDFDHIKSDVQEEVLRGFDLREEGFNDWLREVRGEFDARDLHWGVAEASAQVGRRWYVEVPACSTPRDGVAGISDFVCDSILESLSVVGLHAVVDRRPDVFAPPPRATDMIVRMREICIGTGCALRVSVTDGFGSLKWQVRREMDLTQWSDVRAIQVEIAQLLQDFAIQTEAGSLRGSRWSAYANGCQALMGVLVPGSISAREIGRCSEAAIAAEEKGLYHALLGFSKLLLYGERELRTVPDADEVMQSFRTAQRMAPGNGLVLALVGHSYGFLMRDLDRNAAMTREAVRLLPGSGACWLFHAISLVYCSRFADAVRAATRAVTLCQGTMAQPMALSAELFARLMMGDMRGAIRAGEASLDSIVFRPTIVDLMTAYAMEGRAEEGRAKLALLVRREPDLSLDMLKSDSYPIVNATHRGRVIDAVMRLGAEVTDRRRSIPWK